MSASLRSKKSKSGPKAEPEVDEEDLVLVWGARVPEHEVLCFDHDCGDRSTRVVQLTGNSAVTVIVARPAK